MACVRREEGEYTSAKDSVSSKMSEGHPYVDWTPVVFYAEHGKKGAPEISSVSKIGRQTIEALVRLDLSVEKEEA